MDFPRMVHKAGGLFLVVPDQSTYDTAIADGWAHSKRVFDVPSQVVNLVTVVTDETPDDVPMVDIPVKRKPGRPKKAATE